MKIDKIQITVKELADGYIEKGAGGIEGVVAYGGKLDVRPPYQREYVYDVKERDEVIRTVKKGFPLNIMYWAKAEDGHYELMDGQQRTISICRYAAESERTFAVDEKYYFNLEKDIQEKIDNYILDIYICDGTESEIKEWFRTINIAGEELYPQELRNASYVSKWLTDAKRYFSRASKSGKRPAEQKFGKYTKADANRQLLLEQVIEWRVDSSADEDICAYMVDHMKDDNAADLWNYFNEVVDWVLENFGEYDSGMKGIEWGFLYNAYGDLELDPEEVTETFSDLMTAKKTGELTSTVAKIVEYCITGNEQLLSHRAFTTGQRTVLYKRQNGICPDCGEHFIIEKMDAHHIQSWRSGGVTVLDNGVMLCKECHHKRHGY